ncbi:MAG: hypothetical protein V1779_07745 [bacterium]
MFKNNLFWIRTFVFSLGMSSVIFQVMILREFLSVVQGNELTIGIILASWMLFTGLGALAGKVSHKIMNKFSAIAILHLLFSILPILLILALRYFWYDVFLPGELLSITDIIFSSFVILIPFTFISGFLFTLYCSVSDLTSNVSINYYYETAGSAAGGLLISLVFIFIFDTIQTALLVSILNLVVLLFFSSKNKLYIFSIIITVFVLGNILLFTTNIDDKSKEFLFPSQKLIEQKETPYGNVAVTKTGSQINVFESGILSATSDNAIQNEESVHFAMVQHPNPKKVLLVGGGIFGVTDEILKYQPFLINYIEPNEYLIEINKKYGRLQSGEGKREKGEGRRESFDKLRMTGFERQSMSRDKVEIIIDDALIYLKKIDKKYDVIILNIGAPATAQLNRYYTREFFELIEKHLVHKGLFSLKMPGTVNYVSNEAGEEQSIVLNTLKSVFKNVIIIPSNSNYFIAGNCDLTYDIPCEIEARNIETKYVNKYYLNEFSLMQRADFIAEAFDRNAEINTNFKPVAFYSHINYFLSYYETNKLWIILLLAVIFGVILFRMKKLDFVMFSAGYALSLSEIIIIFSFQIIFGYVYQYIGIIIALFMFGMSIGAFAVNKYEKFKGKNSIPVYLIIIIAFLISLPLMLKGMNSINIHEIFIHIVFAVLSLFVSFLTGGLFTLLSLKYEGNSTKTAGNIYSADLFGSALGAILVSVFLLPLIGFEWSCFSGAGLVLMGMVMYGLSYGK